MIGNGGSALSVIVTEYTEMSFVQTVEVITEM